MAWVATPILTGDRTVGAKSVRLRANHFTSNEILPEPAMLAYTSLAPRIALNTTHGYSGFADHGPRLLHLLAGSGGHVHQAAAGANGDVIYPLVVTSADGLSGTFNLTTELTPEQVAAYNAGELYVNLHTEMNQGGELRGQLMGGMAGM